MYTENLSPFFMNFLRLPLYFFSHFVSEIRQYRNFIRPNIFYAMTTVFFSKASRNVCDLSLFIFFIRLLQFNRLFSGIKISKRIYNVTIFSLFLSICNNSAIHEIFAAQVVRRLIKNRLKKFFQKTFQPL